MNAFCYTFLGLLFFPTFLFSQSSITLTDIYQDQKFQEKGVDLQFHPDGRHFTRLEERRIGLYDLGSGRQMRVLFSAPSDIDIEAYSFDPEGKKLLIQANSERIYRHSQRADFLVYDLQSQALTSIWEEGKQRYAAFSPDGDKVAFVFQNDLYYRDLVTDAVVRITQDGQLNRIINGAADWVYEEEFGLTRAFAWSPDSRYLAFLRFDETEVPEFTMMNYLGEVYPQPVVWKYPKVGQAVATVSAHVFDLTGGQTREIALPDDAFPYVPRIGWSPDGQLYLFRMNRHQNELELWLTDADAENVQKILTERDAAYVELHDNLLFLPRQKGFLWTSERNGWNHIYHYNLRGRLVAQLTEGEWEVSKILGYDDANDRIYFQSTERSPLERHLFSIQLNGKGKTILNNRPGWHEAQFSPDFAYAFISHSTINAPPTHGFYTNQGNLRYWLEENNVLAAQQKLNKAAAVDFWSFKTKAGEELNGWMIKPPGFQQNREYPLLMYVYGGPGSQRVANRWNAMRDYWWLQMMAQNGYLIACVDNRGAGGRGARFQKQTYLKLGQYETEDQIEAARYLAGQSYVDAKRIGIYGKSYGGYLASLCLLRGGEVFAAGMALAPVTHWQWYDCVYTERYMRTVEENPDGYRAGAPVNFAEQLVDPFLLVHGLGDDNVHFQHSAELSRALVDANKAFDTQFYPNVDHSLRGGNTALHLYTRMTNFLDEHLQQNAAAAPSDLESLRLKSFQMMTPGDKSDLYLKKKKIPEELKQKIKNNQ